MACPNPTCGREHNRSKTGFCGRCAQRKRRQDPAKRAKDREAVKRYGKKNPEKRARWVQTYCERVQYYAPAALQELRRANKALEQALSAANRRRKTGGPG